MLKDMIGTTRLLEDLIFSRMQQSGRHTPLNCFKCRHLANKSSLLYLLPLFSKKSETARIPLVI
jgi:hypothetical protein